MAARPVSRPSSPSRPRRHRSRFWLARSPQAASAEPGTPSHRPARPSGNAGQGGRLSHGAVVGPGAAYQPRDPRASKAERDGWVAGANGCFIEAPLASAVRTRAGDSVSSASSIRLETITAPRPQRSRCVSRAAPVMRDRVIGGGAHPCPVRVKATRSRASGGRAAPTRRVPRAPTDARRGRCGSRRTGRRSSRTS